jgi:hypothetical protein
MCRAMAPGLVGSGMSGCFSAMLRLVVPKPRFRSVKSCRVPGSEGQMWRRGKVRTMRLRREGMHAQMMPTLISMVDQTATSTFS